MSLVGICLAFHVCIEEARTARFQPDDGIGDGIAKVDTDGSGEHRETGPTVGACVVAIGDERGAADLLADLDAEDRDAFVADETDQ